MATIIRLSRHGARKHPFYRIVVTDSRSPRDGRYIEQLGTYDSSKEPVRIEVKRDKLENWLSKGAKPTETVAHALKRAGFPSKVGVAPAPAASA